MEFMGRKERFVCANCGYEGVAQVKGVYTMMWVVIAAIAWNAWMFHKANLDFEAVVACVFALFSAWVAQKLPRWIQCPACNWKHPVGKGERHF